jgi:hypothetical protein
VGPHLTDEAQPGGHPLDWLLAGRKALGRIAFRICSASTFQLREPRMRRRDTRRPADDATLSIRFDN